MEFTLRSTVYSLFTNCLLNILYTSKIYNKLVYICTWLHFFFQRADFHHLPGNQCLSQLVSIWLSMNDQELNQSNHSEDWDFYAMTETSLSLSLSLPHTHRKTQSLTLNINKEECSRRSLWFQSYDTTKGVNFRSI